MSMSTYAVGVIPADESFRKKKAAYDACIEAEVSPPEELSDDANNGGET